MARRIIDLSIYLENDVVSDPPGFQPRIDYVDHRQSRAQMLGFFPGLTSEDLPDGHEHKDEDDPKEQRLVRLLHVVGPRAGVG